MLHITFYDIYIHNPRSPHKLRAADSVAKWLDACIFTYGFFTLSYHCYPLYIIQFKYMTFPVSLQCCKPSSTECHVMGFFLNSPSALGISGHLSDAEFSKYSVLCTWSHQNLPGIWFYTGNSKLQINSTEHQIILTY